MCLLDYLKQSQTWNASFSCTGAGGFIKRWLSFLDLLAIWVTRGNFLTLTQWFTCWNHYTINKLASAHFLTIPCDNSLIYPICTIIVLTSIGDCYKNNIRMQKWLLRAVKISLLETFDWCAFFWVGLKLWVCGFAKIKLVHKFFHHRAHSLDLSTVLKEK